MEDDDELSPEDCKRLFDAAATTALATRKLSSAFEVLRQEVAEMRAHHSKDSVPGVAETSVRDLLKRAGDQG